MQQIRIQKRRNRSSQRRHEISSETETTTSTRTAPDLSAADELLRRIDELVAEA